ANFHPIDDVDDIRVVFLNGFEIRKPEVTPLLQGLRKKDQALMVETISQRRPELGWITDAIILILKFFGEVVTDKEYSSHSVSLMLGGNLSFVRLDQAVETDRVEVVLDLMRPDQVIVAVRGEGCKFAVFKVRKIGHIVNEGKEKRER